LEKVPQKEGCKGKESKRKKEKGSSSKEKIDDENAHYGKSCLASGKVEIKEKPFKIRNQRR